MNADDLRAACERAGLTIVPPNRQRLEALWSVVETDDADGTEWRWSELDPALPAYVAERLVGMMRALDPKAYPWPTALWGRGLGECTWAEPELRIKAAMEVLS